MALEQLEQALTRMVSPRPAACWQLAAPASPDQLIPLMQRYAVPPLLAQMLHARGFAEDFSQSEALLQPQLTLSAIPALPEAARRIIAAIKRNQTIMVHGDYDADGITGTALLCLGLGALGAQVVPYIPNRLSDGYGIHPARVAEHASRCQLFITVDCGVTNLQEIAALQAAGVEVIVSDHHQPGQALPDCLLVHPKTIEHPEGAAPVHAELTGAGVAYHLLWQVHQQLGLEPPLAYSDIASIGTVADVAPLLGDNRALVVQGLQQMQQSQWVGMRAMMQQSKLSQPSARDLAFVLAPRINAAGRLGEADLALEMLMTGSSQRAKVLASYLEQRNQQRQAIQQTMLSQALEVVDASAPAIVVADTDGNFDWNPGVMGIVASQLLERFYKPVYIIAKGKGSVRSTPGISAVGALRAAAPLLSRYGGHSQAAGFAFEPQQTEALRQALCAYVADYPRPQPRVEPDALLHPSQLSRDIIEASERLEPFGEGMRPPTFALCGSMDMARAVGKHANHLQLRIAGVKGVAWNQGFAAERLRQTSRLEAAVSLQENVWRGKRSLEFIAEEVRPAEQLSLKPPSTQSQRIQFVRPSDKTSTDANTLRLQIQGSAIHNADAMAHSACWHCTRLPLDESEPLQCTAPLSQLLQQTIAQGACLTIDLGDGEIQRLERYALHFPSIGEMRLAFHYVRKQQAIPLLPDKAALCQKILQELELVDGHGRVIRTAKGEKRDPYQATSLVQGMLEQYKLFGLLSSYHHLDAAGFDLTLKKLFVA